MSKCKSCGISFRDEIKMLHAQDECSLAMEEEKSEIREGIVKILRTRIRGVETRSNKWCQIKAGRIEEFICEYIHKKLPDIFLKIETKSDKEG